ncbi:MAG: RluA family pseudouridine synthase [Candidatus Krumholzibacteria bacterium]|nr:RluA family pseudouridine synthase [Candidatus Krumholzibacteria bacterium]
MIPAEKKQLTLTCHVDAYRAHWTIVAFLAHRFKYHTAEAWEQRVSEAWVTVNGAAVAPGHVVHKDDTVGYTIWHSEPEVDDRYQVLYEDDDLLAVSKSGNIPVHACGVFITHTLIARLKRDFGEGLNLCHRLDRETSGVVVLAKNRESNRVLAGAFARGDVEKSYLAAVFGHARDDAFDVDAPIGKIDVRSTFPTAYARGKANDVATYLPKRQVDVERGKPACTRFRVLRRGETGGVAYTALRAVPAQGRTNQIRVHLAHAGHPLLGDKTYALSGEARDELLREGLTARVRRALVTPRHALHCERLAFAHPRTETPLEILAPAPADLTAFV